MVNKCAVPKCTSGYASQRSSGLVLSVEEIG